MVDISFLLVAMYLKETKIPIWEDSSKNKTTFSQIIFMRRLSNIEKLTFA